MTTKTIDATDLRNNLGEAIDIAAAGDTLLVKKRGKLRVAMINLDRYEDLLAASDPDYRRSIAEARAQYQKGEVFTLEEAFGDI
jgi:PHD/YefM family antitoxin component YafN of YafNO toxin-antitoxin module